MVCVLASTNTVFNVLEEIIVWYPFLSSQSKLCHLWLSQDAFLDRKSSFLRRCDSNLLPPSLWVCWYSEGLDWSHCLPIPELDQWISGSGFRIRIRFEDGYMEQEHGSVLQGEDPDPRPSPAHPPTKPEPINQTKSLNWLSNTPNYIFLFFVWNPRDVCTDGILYIFVWSDNVLFFLV